MIGIIVLFLTAVHLAVGMLGALLLVAQRELGERFFRFNAAASLLLMALAELVYRGYNPRVVAPERALAWKARIDAGEPLLWAAAGLVLVYLASLPFRRYSASAFLLLAAFACGVAHLVRVGSGFVQSAIPARLATLVFPTDMLLSSLALGSVVVSMILGHWYLVLPGMSVRPLRRVAALFFAVVALRVLLEGYTCVLVWRDLEQSGTDILSNDVLLNLLFFGQRVLFGLALPLALSWMIWQTVKIRSTQSATGILYVAVVFVLFGEFLSRFILVSTGYPI